jgi:hypothetical protein
LGVGVISVILGVPVGADEHADTVHGFASTVGGDDLARALKTAGAAGVDRFLELGEFRAHLTIQLVETGALIGGGGAQFLKLVGNGGDGLGVGLEVGVFAGNEEAALGGLGSGGPGCARTRNFANSARR